MAHVLGKKWRSQDVKLREKADFSALLLSDRMLNGLWKAGFKKPSPIQMEAVPAGRFGKDMMVQAKSGTGKTLVFAIIALEKLRIKLFRPQVLIVTPTREIAMQVCSVINTIGFFFQKLTCNCFIGGLPLFDDQEKAVMSQIIVGTPGRLSQLIQLKSLPTNSIRLLIFDEADELLHSASFKDDIEDIFNSLPDEKQVIATSATYNPKVKKMMYQYLCDPHLVRLNAKHLALLGMVHYAAVVEFCPMSIILYRTKLEVLEKILKTVKFAQCLLFCNGIQKVEVLYKDVKRFGFSATYISSAKEQGDRLKAMDKLKRFKCKVLVSSDLTSRGIDAENVDLVINFDLSFTSEVYMHRVGRAGRYGSIGVAISLIDDKEFRHLKRIEKDGSFKTFKLPDPIPSDLILNPPEAEFVIEDPRYGNGSGSETRSGIIQFDALNDNDYDKKWAAFNKNHYDKSAEWNNDNSENEVNEKNIEVGSVSDASDNASENVLSELVVDDAKFHDSVKHALECEMKDKKGVQNGVARLKRKKIKTIRHIKRSTNKKLQNGHTNEDGIELDKNKNSDLLNGFDQNELISNESTDKPYVCDIYEKPNGDFCDINVLEEQDIIENDVHNVLEKADFDKAPLSSEQKDVENISKDGSTDNLFKSSEPEHIVKNMEDDQKCAKESLVNSCGKLNGMIKVFLDTHENESIKRFESIKSKNTVECDSQQMKDSGQKQITTDMINNLQFQKHEFFFKMFKKFQEKKDKCSDISMTVKEDKGKRNEECSNVCMTVEEDKGKSNEQNSNLDLINEVDATTTKLAEKSEFETKDISPEKFLVESNSLVNEDINTVHTKMAVTSDLRSKDFPEKPTFESTPQASEKIKQISAKISTDDICKPNFQNNISHLSRYFSDDETDSDDSVSSEETSEVPKQSSTVDSKSHSACSDSGSSSSSSDSSSVSPSSDSEDDSDSESDSSSGSESSSDSSSSAASSLNEDEESIYSHNYSRTGRQNPSLVSGSVRGQLINDRSYYDKYFQDHKCFCCGKRAKKRMPQQRRKQSSKIPNDICSTRFGNVQNVPHPCNSSLYDHRENYFGCGVGPSRNGRLQNFDNSNFTQSHSPREHSRCHQSRNPSSSVVRGRRGQNTIGCPTHQGSFRHHPTPSCFMPTEHRCHPNTPDYPCEQGQLCEIWYNTFYKQWLHIQNVIN